MTRLIAEATVLTMFTVASAFTITILKDIHADLTPTIEGLYLRFKRAIGEL